MPKLKLGKHYGGFFPYNEIRRREYGLKEPLGWESQFKYSLYSSLSPNSKSWDPNMLDPGSDLKKGQAPFVNHGGVFNLEFSPDG